MPVIIVLLLLACLALAIVITRQHRRNHRDRRDLKWYRKTYLTESGWNRDDGSYLLQSFDGGQNWFTLERQADGGLIVLGPADPALLARIRATRELIMYYVEKNGPIDPSSPDDVEILKNAGFTVTKKP